MINNRFKEENVKEETQPKFTSKIKPSKELPIFFTASILWTWIIGFIPVIFRIQDTSLGNIIFLFGAGIGPSLCALGKYYNRVSTFDSLLLHYLRLVMN